jgi:hypothetical protein
MCAMKLGASFLLMGTMATALAGQSAFAQPPCDTSISTPTGATGCTVPMSTVLSAGTLTFDVPTTTVPASSVAGVNNFSFDPSVTDARNGATGWHMQAASAGLTGATSGQNVPLTLANTTGGTPTGANCGTALPTVTSVPVTLGGTTTGPQTFVTVVPHINGFSCTVPLTTSGTYDLTGHSADTYAGGITLTLVAD